jgi:hypothetical protein
MRAAVFQSFLCPEPEFELPDDYGLCDPEANTAVKEAIEDFVGAARVLAPSLGLANFQQRLAAFQDPSVSTKSGTTYDEFFGHQVPRLYDVNGNWLGGS